MSHVNFFLDSVLPCFVTPANSTLYGPGTRFPLGFTLEDLCYFLFKINWNYPKFSSNLHAEYNYDVVGNWFYPEFPMPRPDDTHISVSSDFGSNVPGSYGYTNLGIIENETYIMCNGETGSSCSKISTYIEFLINYSTTGYKVGDLYYPDMTFELNCNAGILLSLPVAYFNSTRTQSQIQDDIDRLNETKFYHDSSGCEEPQQILPLQEFENSSLTVSLPGGFSFSVGGYILPSYTMTEYIEKQYYDPQTCFGYWGDNYINYSSSLTISSVGITTEGNWPYSD